MVALPASGSVGVLLNNGDGTFAALQPYPAGPECVGLAVEVELGDVTGPAGPFVPDGKLDAYVTCSPYVVRLTGDGTGALGSAKAFQLYLPPYLGSATIDFLALVRRPDGNPAPLLALQRAVGSFGRKLCISYELDPEALICGSAPVQGPLAVGDLNGAFAGVPPDEILTGLGGGELGIFGFAHQIPTYFANSVRPVPAASSRRPSATSTATAPRRARRPDHQQRQRPRGLDPRLPDGRDRARAGGHAAAVDAGLDAVAIADVDGDGCNDVVGAGGYGRGMIHLGDGAGGFDGGQDLPQLGYQNPATATRVSHGRGRPQRGRPARARRRRQPRPAADGVPQPLHAGRRRVLRPAVLPPPGDAVPGDRRPRRGRRAGHPAAADTSARRSRAPARSPERPDTPWARPAPTCSSAATGRDVLSGRGGDDCLFGFTGDDLLTGGTGEDMLKGSSGDDRIKGDAGDDELRGDNGNDDITPGAGKDKVTAGAATTRSRPATRPATRSTAAAASTRSPPIAPTSSRTANTSSARSGRASASSARPRTRSRGSGR